MKTRGPKEPVLTNYLEYLPKQQEYMALIRPTQVDSN